jgi:hypothetical protein
VPPHPPRPTHTSRAAGQGASATAGSSLPAPTTRSLPALALRRHSDSRLHGSCPRATPSGAPGCHRLPCNQRYQLPSKTPPPHPVEHASSPPTSTNAATSPSNYRRPLPFNQRRRQLLPSSAPHYPSKVPSMAAGPFPCAGSPCNHLVSITTTPCSGPQPQARALPRRVSSSPDAPVGWPLSSAPDFPRILDFLCFQPWNSVDGKCKMPVRGSSCCLFVEFLHEYTGHACPI